MPASMTRLFVHYVWGTWQRTPWLIGEVRETSFKIIVAKCAALETQVLALNSVEDHVHLLVKMPPMLAVAKLIADAKGAASHAIRQRWPTDSFKWQDGYGAFTVGESTVPTVCNYIANQQAHHHTFGTCEERSVLNPDTL